MNEGLRGSDGKRSLHLSERCVPFMEHISTIRLLAEPGTRISRDQFLTNQTLLSNIKCRNGADRRLEAEIAQILLTLSTHLTG